VIAVFSRINRNESTYLRSNRDKRCLVFTTDDLQKGAVDLIRIYVCPQVKNRPFTTQVGKVGLAGSLPPARDFWIQFSAALGYSGLAIMGLQFGITARFRYITEPWGEDVIYHFHRQISLFAVALVIVHPLIMFAVRPELLALPQYGEVPWGAVFAFLSVFSLLALVVTALWRAKLRIPYETWHIAHIALAIIAVTGGLLHMVGWSFYLVDPWKRALWIGLTIFWIALVFYVRIVKPLLMFRRPYRVTEVRHERGDTTTLVMQPDGHSGFRFSPGQFGWLTVWGRPFKITAHPFLFSSSARQQRMAMSRCRSEIWVTSHGRFTRSRWADVFISTAHTVPSPSAIQQICMC
jgi:predicted ferric reductase